MNPIQCVGRRRIEVLPRTDDTGKPYVVLQISLDLGESRPPRLLAEPLIEPSEARRFQRQIGAALKALKG